MKKYLGLSLMLLLFPIVVSAYNVGQYNTRPGTVYLKDWNFILYKDNGSTIFDIYLDNESVNNDIVLDGSNYKYVIPKDVVVKSIDYSSERVGSTYNVSLVLYLESLNLSDYKVHCFIDGKEPSEVQQTYGGFDKKYCDDYAKEGSYYSSNEILLLYSTLSNVSYYGTDGNRLNYSRTQIDFFPKNGDKETYWAFTNTDNTGYKGYISPVFEEYVPPKFELKCNPKTIKYGESSTCTLYGTTNLDLKNLNFDFDPKEYKVLGATFPDGIENKSGDKQYNLVISDDYDQTGEGFVLGVFEITGKENKKYTDDVQVINLDFVDEKVQGKYVNLEDPVEIVAFTSDSTKELKEEENPDTSSSLSVIIPTVLFVVTLIIFFAVDKKKKIKSIS